MALETINGADWPYLARTIQIYYIGVVWHIFLWEAVNVSGSPQRLNRKYQLGKSQWGFNGYWRLTSCVLVKWKKNPAAAGKYLWEIS
jgi:hypothetical protein